MASDFVISRPLGQWQVVAISDRGKAFAAGDPRLRGGTAALEPAGALAMYQALHDEGFFVSVPDGLPPVGGRLIALRLMLLLSLIVLPILAFALLA